MGWERWEGFYRRDFGLFCRKLSRSTLSNLSCRIAFLSPIFHLATMALSLCSELNGPMLAAGASFTAMMAATAETAEFHDQLNPTKASFEGTIMVSMTAMGPY
jgi:hypothetical protein